MAVANAAAIKEERDLYGAMGFTFRCWLARERSILAGPVKGRAVAADPSWWADPCVDSGLLCLIEDFNCVVHRIGGVMTAPHLLVHNKKDTVGVVVVEGLKAGTNMTCVVTANNSSFRLKSKMAVPIGHKIALVDIKKGDTVMKYGQDIGKTVADIKKGEHVHVHNLKTKRW
jgi:(2R)-sulfolactate sulfo-lyase subunit alpha